MSLHALICGISGQDGAYLARLLLDKGYLVTGTSRDAQVASFANLSRLGIMEQVRLESMALTDFRSTLQTIAKVQPNEIYNLAGQSSVGLSFEQPVETMESISIGTLNLLESIRFLDKTIRLYNASSSECFGDTRGSQANEQTPFHPQSPYAVAKSAAHWTVTNYRHSYGLFASNGILFNHESPLRPKRFVTQKIISAVCAIKNGTQQTLRLGNLDIYRDWGAADEYVDAMWRMLQIDDPIDLVIGTGETNSLRDFAAAAFEEVGLDWANHVVPDNTLKRPSDLLYSAADPRLAMQRIGWSSRKSMRDIVHDMINWERGNSSPSDLIEPPAYAP